MDTNEETVNISKKRLEYLERAYTKLTCLENGGVDNWEWYGESLEEFRKIYSD